MKTPVYKILYVQVLIAIVLGGQVLFGHFDLGLAQKMTPSWRRLRRADPDDHRAPIICTVVSGIAEHGGHEEGRAASAARALIYFEVMSTIALVVGLLVAHMVHPGSGFNVDPKTLDGHAGARPYADFRLKGQEPRSISCCTIILTTLVIERLREGRPSSRSLLVAAAVPAAPSPLPGPARA